VTLSAKVGTTIACTPIAVAFLPEPVITWADLRGVRFAEPFFRDTIVRVEGARPRFITGIEALRAGDAEAGLDPALIVFHASRCGSTLLSQMLAAVPTNHVIAEPTPINQTLAAPMATPDRLELVRLLLRAFGRSRAPGSRRLVVKLSSWNVCFAALVRAAFPRTPLVWLQRDPCAVVASQIERPAGWVRWHRDEDPALSIFGITPGEAHRMSEEAFILRAIEAIHGGAIAGGAGRDRDIWQVVDHDQLPDALWGSIAAHAGISWTDDERERFRQRARFNSKTDVTDPFVRRDVPAPLSEQASRFIAARIEPLYRALGHDEPSVHQLPNRRVDR
jgi:hypothetical protein